MDIGVTNFFHPARGKTEHRRERHRMHQVAWSLPLALTGILSGPWSVNPMAQTAKPGEPLSDAQILEHIREANTAERYEALARYYEEQAAKARKEAQDYRAQYDCYVQQEKANEKAGISLAPSKLSSFCYSERKQYLDIAKENEAMAGVYREMAHEAEKQRPPE